MSRHEIPHKKYFIVVGWDHPMQTFFAQVKKSKNHDYHQLWVGTQMREVYEIDKLEHLLRHYTKLTPELKATLYGDKDEGR